MIISRASSLPKKIVARDELTRIDIYPRRFE
jgi:hypothetical protein